MSSRCIESTSPRPVRAAVVAVCVSPNKADQRQAGPNVAPSVLWAGVNLAVPAVTPFMLMIVPLQSVGTQRGDHTPCIRSGRIIEGTGTGAHWL